ELSDSTPGTSSSQMRECVMSARHRQRRRFAGSNILRNVQMRSRELRQHCRLDPAGNDLLRACMTELGLSARAHDKILRVSRTIADLADSDQIQAAHVSEAINYRTLDRQLWS